MCERALKLLYLWLCIVDGDSQSVAPYCSRGTSRKQIRRR